jgi:hypothetical protein
VQLYKDLAEYKQHGPLMNRCKSVFARYGIPEEVCLDNGPWLIYDKRPHEMSLLISMAKDNLV